MFKMGAFSTLFVVPTMILSLCEAYHFFVLYRWYPTTINCKENGGSANCPRHDQPQAEVYLIALVMSMATGISTSLWILSTKTLHSWRRFICCHSWSAKDKKPVVQSPITTYVPASQTTAQQNPLVTQIVNGQLVTNHYIPLSMLTNSNGTSRQGYSASENWKQPNAL
jgi:hypothetical protein